MNSRAIVIEECVNLNRYWDDVKKRHRSTELILTLLAQYEAGDKIYPDKLALKYMNDPEYSKEDNPFQCQTTVRNLLVKLAGKGLLKQCGSGRRGDPYYYERVTVKQTMYQPVSNPEAERNGVTDGQDLQSIEARLLRMEQSMTYMTAMLKALCDSLGIADRAEV